MSKWNEVLFPVFDGMSVEWRIRTFRCRFSHAHPRAELSRNRAMLFTPVIVLSAVGQVAEVIDPDPQRSFAGRGQTGRGLIADGCGAGGQRQNPDG